MIRHVALGTPSFQNLSVLDTNFHQLPFSHYLQLEFNLISIKGGKFGKSFVKHCTSCIQGLGDMSKLAQDGG